MSGIRMVLRQPPTNKRCTLTLPSLLFAMLFAFAIMNAQYMPLIDDETARTSRVTAWEGGVPSQSYESTLKKSYELHARSASYHSAPASIFKRTSGEGWKMWDRESILFEDLDLTCNWNEYRPFVPRGQAEPSPAQFCAHPLSDDHFVSNSIVKKGRHVECDILPKLLSDSIARSNGVNENQPILYADIGANIGTCVMQMLLTTNATIMAFEPHPYNLFVMTSTFMKLDKKYRDRIHLFPIALGEESSESTIHMASDNRGHAVVSKIIRINRKATFLPPQPIRVEPLDSILAKDKELHLIKMDAQGFECYIFEGMKRVLQNTRNVFFELERQVLNGFDRCSPQVLWKKFIESGFAMHVGGLKRAATEEMPDKGRANIIATK